MNIDTTLAIRRIASGVAWFAVGIHAAAVVVDVDRGQYHAASVSLTLIVIVLAFLSVKDSIERGVDALAGKAIADRTVSEITLKAVSKAFERGEYAVDVHGERARAVN